MKKEKKDQEEEEEEKVQWSRVKRESQLQLGNVLDL